VYNFEVEGFHTYYVAGAAGARAPPVLVHNKSASQIAKALRAGSSLPKSATSAIARTRKPAETAAARQFFKNHKELAKKLWSQRSGRKWPKNATHCEHEIPLKSGGDPLHVKPGFSGPTKPHMKKGKDGLTDFQRWGKLGGKASAKARKAAGG
jgi:hypothetical protein